jgi:hypothetical protein
MRALARSLAALSVVAAALVAADLAVVPAAQAAGTTVTVTDGGAPGWVRFDDHGNGVDAHDGEIKQFGSAYYLYGTSYGCGYVRMVGYGADTTHVPTPFCGDAIYRSTDLRHWTYVGHQAFDQSASAPTDWQKICNSATLSCYRPHVIYDANAHMYRLWVNTYETAADGIQHGFHVLSSASPAGPFVEQANASGGAVLPKLAYPSGGDFDLYQDANGTGYIVYAVTDGDPYGRQYNYKLIIEQLSSDYTTGTGTFTALDTRKTEAPSMFRRGSDYYITMSDPQCGYCAGTGTAYLRARSPLGPWRGLGSNVALTSRQLFVDSKYGLFTGFDDATRSQLLGLRNYDVKFAARPVPSASNHVNRVGWMFRAKDAGNGYLWVLSSAAYAGKPTRLARELVKNGRVVSTTNIGVATRLSTTSMNTIRTRANGTIIKTWLNGKLIDRFIATKASDTSFHAGYAGIREAGGYSAYFDNFSVSRPPALGYTLYLADNFNGTNLTTFPTLGRFRRHGLSISATSCGGQPDDVAMLRAPNASGYEYLFQSDRWDHADPNEGQATQYWEPLKFNADGSIQALSCGQSYTTTLTGASPTSAALDLSNDGYSLVQDIMANHARGETFPVTQASSNTQNLTVTVFETDDSKKNPPNQPLTVSIYDYANDPDLLTPLSSAVVQSSTASAVPWSPTSIPVTLHAALTGTASAPHIYAFVLRTTSTTAAYGVARGDGTIDNVPAGSGLDVTTPGSAATVEPAHDLRFSLTLG